MFFPLFESERLTQMSFFAKTLRFLSFSSFAIKEILCPSQHNGCWRSTEPYTFFLRLSTAECPSQLLKSSSLRLCSSFNVTVTSPVLFFNADSRGKKLLIYGAVFQSSFKNTEEPLESLASCISFATSVGFSF